MTVETLITIPLREVKWGLGGAISGAVFCITPLELMVLPAAVLFIVLAVKAAGGNPPHRAFGAGFVAMLVLGFAAPFKPGDERVQLSASTLSLPLLAKELRVGHRNAPNVAITLPSTSPTWSEIDRAVREQTSMKLVTRLCGTSSTVLFGAYPIGRHLEPQ